MKPFKLLLLAVLSLALSAQAQNLSLKVNKKGKVGFVDQNGKEVIKCQYDHAYPFQDGIAIVNKSGKSGIIDTKGKVRLPLKYTLIQSWGNDLFLVSDGKKFGIVNYRGEFLAKPKYTYISKANRYGKALIVEGGKVKKGSVTIQKAKYGIINSNGDIVIEPKFKGLYEFDVIEETPTEGVEMINNQTIKKVADTYLHLSLGLNKKSYSTLDTLTTDCSHLGFGKKEFPVKPGLLDGNGKVLIKEGTYQRLFMPRNGIVRYVKTKKKKNIWGYHNLRSGTDVDLSNFANSSGEDFSCGDFIGDISPIYDGESWSFINRNGQTLRSGYMSVKYSPATALWAAENATGGWDVFDNSSKEIASLSGYQEILFPDNANGKETYSVKKDNLYGCINREGNIVAPFEYEYASGSKYGIIAVRKNGKWGLISASGGDLISLQYEGVSLPSKLGARQFWVTKSDSLFYHYNLDNERLSSVGYSKVSDFINGLAFVVPIDLKVEETQVNRAQLLPPNSPKSKLNSFNFSKRDVDFGYLIDTNDVQVFDLPFSTFYMDAVREAVGERSSRVFNEKEKKNILLKVTQSNRSYDLKSTIGEEEWSY